MTSWTPLHIVFLTVAVVIGNVLEVVYDLPLAVELPLYVVLGGLSALAASYLNRRRARGGIDE